MILEITTLVDSVIDQVMDRLATKNIGSANIDFDETGIHIFASAYEEWSNDNRDGDRSVELATNDCINRQAAIDVINFEDKWLFDAKSHNEDTKIAFSSMKSKISELPSAQPEIISCKDCRHNGSFDTDCPIDWNGKEYCSFAER